MEAIKHYLTIKSTPEKIYNAITTEEGLKSWWAKQTVAKLLCETGSGTPS